MSAVQKMRYRVQFRLFRKPLVVLQIAENVPVNYDPADPYDLGPYAHALRWRDAVPEDMTEFSFIAGKCK